MTRVRGAAADSFWRASPRGIGLHIGHQSLLSIHSLREDKPSAFFSSSPTFRAVSADQHLPPQSVKEKFKTATLDSLDYSSFIFVGGQAGVAQANNSYPEFGQGAKGYGRYYWHTLADAINENYWVEFIVPSALHQDTRYYTLGRGDFAKRLGYAFTRIVITRTDSGHETFNFSEILGAGAFSGVANLYYPSQERTLTKTYQRWITNSSH